MFCYRFVVAPLLSVFVAHAALAQSFSFTALGDLPYGEPAKVYEPYRQLIQTINGNKTDFSIHVGDIKSGSTICSDTEFAEQKKHFDLFAGAVVYTPGDNEWTDCHRKNNGSFDPIERLQAVRNLYFKPGVSLGQKPLRLQNQSTEQPAHPKYIENARWMHKGVLFVTLHIVGSNNSFEVRDPKAVAEFFERDEANVQWIQAAYAYAAQQKARAIVFSMQADMFEEKEPVENFAAMSGFRRSIGETLLPLAEQWKKPVLLIHGDGHVFKIDQPFRHDKKPLRNVTRLEVPGASDVRAVRVQVSEHPVQPFAFELFGAP
jgi:hypothetical protein